MSKLLPKVLIVTFPAEGAVQDHQTDLPPLLPAWLGSPASLVAPEFTPASAAEDPPIAFPLEQRSLAGPVDVVAAWETVKVWPAMVSVAVRGLVVELAVTDHVTEPLPAPLAGVQVNQVG